MSAAVLIGPPRPTLTIPFAYSDLIVVQYVYPFLHAPPLIVYVTVNVTVIVNANTNVTIFVTLIVTSSDFLFSPQLESVRTGSERAKLGSVFPRDVTATVTVVTAILFLSVITATTAIIAIAVMRSESVIVTSSSIKFIRLSAVFFLNITTIVFLIVNLWLLVYRVLQFL